MQKITKTIHQRNYTIDLLRVLAIIGVVIIHVTSRSLEQGNYDLLRLNTSLFLNQAFRFAVPLFFLISGFTLEYRYIDRLPIMTFFKKRISKLLIPYVFWSALYFVVLFKNSITDLLSLNFLQQLLLGTASIQMYFIPSIALLYLLFPFLHKYLYLLLSKRLLIFLTIFEIILLFVDYYTGGLQIINPFRIALLNVFIFTIGMLSAHRQKEIKEYIAKHARFFVALMIASLVSMIIESRSNYLNTYDINFVTSQWRWSTVFYTLTFSGIIFSYFHNEHMKFSKLIRTLSRLSFFVFFVHLFFITLFWRFIGSYLFSRSASHILENVFFDPLVCVFVIFLSFLTAYFLSFIPKIGWVFGIEAN